MKSIITLSAAALAAASPLELQATPTTTDQCTQPPGAPPHANSDTICPCYGWEQVGAGEDCAAVAARNGLSEDTVVQWNP